MHLTTDILLFWQVRLLNFLNLCMNELFSLVVLKASSGGRQKLAFFLAGRGPPWPNYKENNLGYLFFPSKPRREKTQKKRNFTCKSGSRSVQMSPEIVYNIFLY